MCYLDILKISIRKELIIELLSNSVNEVSNFLNLKSRTSVI